MEMDALESELETNWFQLYSSPKLMTLSSLIELNQSW